MWVAPDYRIALFTRNSLRSQASPYSTIHLSKTFRAFQARGPSCISCCISNTTISLRNLTSKFNGRIIMFRCHSRPSQRRSMTLLSSFLRKTAKLSALRSLKCNLESSFRIKSNTKWSLMAKRKSSSEVKLIKILKGSSSLMIIHQQKHSKTILTHQNNHPS